MASTDPKAARAASTDPKAARAADSKRWPVRRIVKGAPCCSN